jgi:hypothetical protein
MFERCPYCGEKVELEIDEFVGEDEVYQDTCPHCGKNFIFTASFSIDYHPEKADCLNDGKHNFELTHTYPEFMRRMRCTMCDEDRKLTEEERKLYNVPTAEEWYKKHNEKEQS